MTTRARGDSSIFVAQPSAQTALMVHDWWAQGSGICDSRDLRDYGLRARSFGSEDICDAQTLLLGAFEGVSGSLGGIWPAITRPRFSPEGGWPQPTQRIPEFGAVTAVIVIRNSRCTYFRYNRSRRGTVRDVEYYADPSCLCLLFDFQCKILTGEQHKLPRKKSDADMRL